MASKWTEILVTALAGPIEAVLTDQLSQLLAKIEPLEARATVLTTLYPAIDVQLEDLAAGTKGKLDDAGVRALKTAIETVAEDSDIELPNLDKDKPND